MNPKDVNYNIIIFILMIVTGCIIYFMFFQTIEKFESTTIPVVTDSDASTDVDPSSTEEDPISTPPTNTDPTSTPPTNTDPTTTSPTICFPAPPKPKKSIVSRYFGIGFNIDYVNYNNTDTYFINHIPTVSNGTMGGCYSITQNSLLTIKLKNNKDNTQLWRIREYDDSVGVFYVITPLTNSKYALQYESGNLAMRPFDKKTKSIFEGQKWLLSTTKITRGIPVLNYSPASLFTPEFDPYSTPSTNTNNITDSNMQQVNDVISAVTAGIQKYLGQLDKKQQLDQVSASSLGQKDHPLNINFSITPESNTSQVSNIVGQKSSFEDVSTYPSSDFLSIMDRYGASSSSGSNSFNDGELYKKNDLDNEISKNQGCKMLNINDYTSNRVASCNCKL